MSIIKNELSDQELFDDIVKRPSAYLVVIGVLGVKVYDETTGDSHECKEPTEEILTKLLNAIGVKTDNV